LVDERVVKSPLGYISGVERASSRYAVRLKGALLEIRGWKTFFPPILITENVEDGLVMRKF